MKPLAERRRSGLDVRGLHDHIARGGRRHHVAMGITPHDVMPSRRAAAMPPPSISGRRDDDQERTTHDQDSEHSVEV